MKKKKKKRKRKKKGKEKNNNNDNKQKTKEKQMKEKWRIAVSNPGVPSYNTYNTRAPLSIRPRRCAYEINDFYYYC